MSATFNFRSDQPYIRDKITLDRIHTSILTHKISQWYLTHFKHVGREREEEGERERGREGERERGREGERETDRERDFYCIS